MSYHLDDTICAIATARGGAARGMVRVSGANAIPVASRIFRASSSLPLAQLRQPTIVEGHSSITLDSATETLPCDVFVWPTNRSYTREPVVELHTFGSQPVLEAIVAVLCRTGARVAEPGEFTLRAFLAGRIDLTQAEAVLGVIDAGANDELQAALAQLAGGLAGPLKRLRDELLQLLAELEAGLDFVDEDIEFITSGELLGRIDSAVALLDGVGQQMASRYTAVGMPQVALVGAPNAGKSSLFNALVERYGVESSKYTMQPAALVSQIEGTTRDYLTAPISCDGLQFELVDTAGVEQVNASGRAPLTHGQATHKPTIEAQAHSLAIERSSRADLRACCLDASRLLSPTYSLPHVMLAGSSRSDVVVLTKSDLTHASIRSQLESSVGRRVVVTSSRTGEGLGELCETLHDILRGRQSGSCVKGVPSTAERCRESIRLAIGALTSAKAITAANGGTELVAEELRGALDELGKVVGAVYTDDLLDRIFSTFCIGK